MPSISIPQRRPLDDDEETEDSDSPPPSNSKRPRFSPAQDVTTSDENEESDSSAAMENSSQASARKSTSLTRASPGDYKPGAIVRIKVTNFVTYNQAEFLPGPKLNMVIGPNGTGKSTLVCAICLGLGWGPQPLGRAKDVGEFVKHGCQEATIEIELAARPEDDCNPVIRRVIKRDGNKSSFMLNNRPIGRADVLKLAQSLGIQVDNLCQFLPQDKVAEFAALSPTDLLRSTQRAAAGPQMLEWHDNLISLRDAQKNLQETDRQKKDMLTGMENRQEMQRPDVERMRQRGDIERKIKNLNIARAIVEYRDFHKIFSEKKETKARLEREHQKLKDDLAPAMQSLTAKETYLRQINTVKEYRGSQATQLSNAASLRGKKIEDLDAVVKELNGKIEAEKKIGKKHREEALAAKQNISRLRRQMDEEPVEFDPDFYNERLKELRSQKREVETKAREIQSTRQPLAEEARRLQHAKVEAERQLKHLDSQSGQQEHKLRRASPDSFKAYQWVLENQHRFQKEVYGPPMVTCSITDPKYADIIESLFQRSDFMAFTTQSREDFITLQQALYKELKLHDITIRTCTTAMDRMRAPLSDSEIQRLGFDGWAKDYLNAPQPVLAMLCNDNGLHQIPVSVTENSPDVYTYLENQSAINCWVEGRTFHRTTRRREYNNATSTLTRDLKPAQVWTSQPLDVSLKQQYQDDIDKFEDEKAKLEEKHNSMRTALLHLRDDEDRVSRELDALEREKSERQTAYTQYRALPEKIAQQETKCKGIHKLFDDIRQRVGEIRDQQDEVSLQKADAAIEYADAVEKFREALQELIKVEIRSLEAESDIKTLKVRHNDYAVMLEQKSREVSKVCSEYKEFVTRGKKSRQDARHAQEELAGQEGGSEVHTMISAEGYDVNQLDADIDSEKARLELTHGGSSHMIKEFEDRERQIQRLREEINQLQSQLDGFESGINEVRGVWEPRLEALVSKINDAFGDSFARIGCAGQVTLYKGEDEPGLNGQIGGSNFGAWAIQVYLKFREHESLSLLDSHRQSGGERAVSTIFYLMALQSLSASPFRVVDEINQGMDPRNERMVHGRLVDIACTSSDESEVDAEGNPVGGGGGGQYFLITPKLLEGLVYRPGMRVLCIYSGEHQPEDYQELDFQRAIRKMRELAGQNGRAIRKDQPQAIAHRSQVDASA
ncbi:hypothetical protein N7492_003294 [Penicillium capsulatum]|uniref:Structural maintenance of chromosomes protein 5 n=1 Tax=Penicillium capsulatum TaxID=69766 RepID=A0A9W9LWT8_9EURO|nr:hypothetical protein N7492_003294 [Penicillium capsulatum]KAJ6122122.1 hypothetical protein N7512_004587 [Penicillium capsulatum]